MPKPLVTPINAPYLPGVGEWGFQLIGALKVPLNQCALRALSRVAAIFTYIEIAALRVLAISEDFLHYVNELGSGVLRNHYIIKVLYVFVFFYSCPGHRPWARVIICVGFFFLLVPRP